VEGGVDRPRLDRGDGPVDVGVQDHDIQLDVGLHAVEVLQQPRWRDPPVDHIDPESAPARTHGRISPLRYPEEFTGVGQERLPVDGELGAAGRADEQAHPQVFL
jgi:hypothetical protein